VKRAVKEPSKVPLAKVKVKGPAQGGYLKRTVELRGLSTARYNGMQGVAITWDEVKER
jgi:hypothetical protein